MRVIARTVIHDQLLFIAGGAAGSQFQPSPGNMAAGLAFWFIGDDCPKPIYWSGGEVYRRGSCKSTHRQPFSWLYTL